MPVHRLECPDCGHTFSGMVLTGTREPEEWVCSACGGNRARPQRDTPPVPHPLESAHTGGCPCCGGTGRDPNKG